MRALPNRRQHTRLPLQVATSDRNPAPPHLPLIGKAIEYIPNPVILVNIEGYIIHANPAAQSVLKYTAEQICGYSFLQLVTGEDREKTAAVITDRQPVSGKRMLENHCYCKDASVVRVKWTIQWDAGEQLHYCFGEEGSLDLAALEKEIIQLNMQPGISMPQVAHALLKGIEKLYPDAICSILRLNADGTLAHYSAPGLPGEYCQMLNGIAPGPKVGSCGTAVYYNKPVIVSDIENDPLWEDYRHMAAAFGLKACWSMPIRHSKGCVLGVFAIYHRYTKEPSACMLQTIERMANLLGLLIENSEMMERLQISNERYLLSTRATHDMIWDWDLQKNEIFRSEEGLLNVYGFSTNEPIRHISDWLERLHPEDKERVKLEIDYIHRCDRETFEVEYRFLRANGVYAFVYDRGYIMRDPSGKPVRLIGAAQDITQRVRNEQLIRDSEERYRYLFNMNPLPMFIYDMETLSFLEVNQMAVQLYGYTMEEFSQMTIYDIPHAREHKRLTNIVKQKKEENKIYKRGKWQHVKKNGELIYVEGFSHKIMYKEREAVLVLVIDISKNILLQQQLLAEKNDRQQELMKATIAVQEKERNEIAYELHDNVNQLLTSAKLYLECVGRYDAMKEEYRLTCYSHINKSIEELRRLSKTMVAPMLGTVSLIQAIGDILKNMEVARSLDIDFNHDGFDETLVEDGLKLTIYRVLQEQTTNILKHANASKVVIRLYKDARFLVLKISDNGNGFDTSALKKGIGITNIINRSSICHGKVDIRSSPGKGCCLSVFFDHR